jgi:hypothetical protein
MRPAFTRGSIVDKASKLHLAACVGGLAWLVASPLSVAKRDIPPPPPLEEVMTMRVEGEIAVDAAGHVTAHRIATKVPDSVRARLDKAIPAWNFHPVPTPEGATDVRTNMELTLAATKQGDGFVIRLEDAVFGHGIEERRGRVTTRTFSRSPYTETDAIVRVAAQADETGRATKTEFVRCTLLNAGGDAEEKALMCRRLEGLSVEAVALSRFQHDEAATWEVWMYFTPQGPLDERAGKWRVESRTPEHAVSWLPKSKPQPSPTVMLLRDGVIGAPL